ncbi:MAG: gliding motility-associated ABC transporter substrate-binding protein GldG, partial [Bacteroidota bacterium]|nr:gliding motility-associated ABC transporter substrate-binding protein GldG [Bacteroidota bacterium]
VNAPGIKKTILLSSSENARTIETPALVSGRENRNAPEDGAYHKKNIAAGVLLEGKFSSPYKNRVGQDVMDSMQRFGTPFLTQCVTDNKMIVIADGDIVLNGTSQGKPLPMGVNSYTVGTQYEYQFANREFVENCLEYLINNAGLTEARAKDYKLRLLDPKKMQDQRTSWQMLNLALPVALVIFFGFIYQYWRKRKYRV